MAYKYICRNCGELTDKSYQKDSCLGSLAWIFFIFISIGIALVFYIIYKINSKSNCCPHCKANNSLVPVDTPIGEELFNKYYETTQE